jgi:hypothetical protein
MAGKDSKDLSEGDRILYDYGRGPVNFTIKSVTVMPENRMDDTNVLLESEQGEERLASFPYDQRFEVPGW